MVEAEKDPGFHALFALELTSRIYWTGDIFKDYLSFLRLNHPLLGLFMHHKMHLVNSCERWVLFLSGIMLSFISAFNTPPTCDPSLPLKCENTCEYMWTSLTSGMADISASPNNGLCFDQRFGFCAWGTMCDFCGPREMPEYCQAEGAHYAWTFAFGIVVTIYLMMLRFLATCKCIQTWSDQGCCGCLKTFLEKLAQISMCFGFCIVCTLVIVFVLNAFGIIYVVPSSASSSFWGSYYGTNSYGKSTTTTSWPSWGSYYGTNSYGTTGSTTSLGSYYGTNSYVDSSTGIAFNWGGFFVSQCTSWGYSFALSAPGFWWTYRKGDPRKWEENERIAKQKKSEVASA